MEELSSPPLRDGSGEEELVSVVGKERRFVLQRGERNVRTRPKMCPRCFFIVLYDVVIYSSKLRHTT